MNKTFTLGVSCMAAAVYSSVVQADTNRFRPSLDVIEHLGRAPQELGEPAGAPSTLRINNIRLEAPPPDAPHPSSLLKFDMVNEGNARVTDVLIQIAIVEKSPTPDAASRPIVHPFVIGGHATIEAGYTVNYEMLLRNLTYDCACVPDVTIVSARPLPTR